MAGGTVRQHLQAATRAGAPRSPELDQPPLPAEFGHVVGWLAALPCPLEWPAFDAWQRVTGRTLARWEVEILMRLDRARQG